MVSSYKKQFRSSILVFVIIGALVIYRMQGLYTGMLEHGYAYTVYPFLRLQQLLVAPCKQFFYERHTKAQLRKDIEKLQQECSALRAQTIELQATLLYGQQIQELVEFKRQFAYQGTITRILACCCSEHEHYLLIDAGSRQGICPDMVAVYKNCLLGRVTQVYPLYSKVTLITDKSCKVAACCATTNASGIHVGTNSTDSTRIERISHLHQVKIGDLVLSSGEGLVFPQGFGLGLVQDAKVDELHQIVHIKPLVDATTLTHCMLIQKGETTNISLQGKDVSPN